MFFVFGSPRSGTTLLAQCLNNHSDIVVPHETSFIIPMAFVFTSIRDPDLGKEMIIKLITRSYDFQTSIGEYLSEERISKIVNECDYHPAHVLKVLYAELALAADKKIAGDKSPNDLLNLNALVSQGGLDDAGIKIIHIVRDIRDVMVSLEKLKWLKDMKSSFPRFWSNSNLYLHSLYPGQKSKYLLIRYEDMVCEPKPVFRHICDFLEVDFQPGMFDFQQFNPRYKGFPAHSKLYASISTNNIGVYKKELSKPLLIACEKQAQEALDVFGYSLEGKNTYFASIKERFRNLLK